MIQKSKATKTTKGSYISSLYKTCNRCDFKWLARIENPRLCPHCKSPNWADKRICAVCEKGRKKLYKVIDVVTGREYEVCKKCKGHVESVNDTWRIEMWNNLRPLDMDSISQQKKDQVLKILASYKPETVDSDSILRLNHFIDLVVFGSNDNDK